MILSIVGSSACDLIVRLHVLLIFYVRFSKYPDELFLFLQFRYLASLNYIRYSDLSGRLQLGAATHTSSQTVRHCMPSRWVLDTRGDPGTVSSGLFNQSLLGKVPGDLATAGWHSHHLFCLAIRRPGTVVKPPDLCTTLPIPSAERAVDGNQ